MTPSLVLLIAALVSALLAAVGATVPRVNLIGLALTCYFASLLWGSLR